MQQMYPRKQSCKGATSIYIEREIVKQSSSLKETKPATLEKTETMTMDSPRRSPDHSSSSSRRRVHLHRRRSLSPREQHQHRPADDDRRQGRRPYYPAAEAWPRGSGVATKVSLRGFDDRLSARDLADHLESVAGTVWRCRVKTSVTPTGSYPDFQLRLPLPGAAAAAASPYDDGILPAHAFVHFADPRARSRAARSGLQLCSRGSRRTRPSAENTHASSPSAADRRPRGIARPMLFPDSRVEVGDLAAPDTFLAAWRGADDPASASAVDFVVDPSAGRCRLLFARDAAFASPAGAAAVLCCDVKLEFPVGDVAEVLAFQSDDSLLLRLSAAPLLYYRTAGDDVHGPVPFDLIDDDDDPWVRTTDVTPGGAIGRCWVYRISFKMWFWPTMRVALEYMKMQGVLVKVIDSRGPGLTVHDELEFGMPMQDMFFSLHHAEGISFPVLYLVNALMHSGIVNRHQLTPEFFGLLKGECDAVNIAALTKLFGGKFQLFDVCRRLRNEQDWAARKSKHLRLLSSGKIGPDDYNAEVRRLVITPTRAYCMPPQLERSNRVIRHYHQLADRFLRVTFMDEGMQRLNTSAMNFCAAQIVKDMMPNSFQQKTTIYRRVQTILTNGFHMCGRNYSFLAFSSNQLRNRSAWFFAEDGTTTTASIREWMGQFPSKNVAKHTARMGQCFTSTYPTVMIQPDEMEFLEDVNHNGYNFSDGIGKITPKLALEVAKKLPLMDKYVPSAFQIRFAGFKGVVAVWPGENEEARWLSLRPSMKKFESAHSVFEVVSWTKLQPAFLNRQIITLLSTLGVPDTVFRQMQNTMLHNLDRILTDSDVAYEVVKTCCPEHGNTAGLMLSAGFAPANEPHLRAMLLAIWSSQMQGLLEKSRICVPKGRWLVGCLDEFGILEQGQCFIRASTPSFNKRFVRHSSIFSSANKNSEIIVGTVVMAKNPCLHPGDVRILEAVDVPELHHLVDCLVFPKKGERPHANEASGSDLDGDVFFVTWDQKLVPPGKRSCTPMDYSPTEAKQLQREVLTHDIIDFYLENLVTDNLGRISNAHVVHADHSEYGAMDDNCIQLAELAATAVDSLKTGEIVTMPTYLRPTEYPDFMGKEDAISYKSTKILGELYRSIKAAYGSDFVSEGTCTSDDLPYDSDLEVSGASDFLEDAWICKCSYEAQLNSLLNQYGVRTEAELVTGEAWSLTGNNKQQQYVTKEMLSYAYFQLHLEFRSIFESIDEISVEKKNLACETKASAWYQVTYHPNWIQRSREMPLRLSFAWIAVDYLARIKMRRRQEAKVSKGQTTISKDLARTAMHFG
ncbi:probable RNA-dependent RNA polymerase SHL2 [Setaria viridis]